MSPEDERGRPAQDRPADYSNTLPLTVQDPACRPCRLPLVWMAVRSPEYARGFIDGWRDRAEYARRTGEADPGGLTFDDGVRLGWELARAMPPPAADDASGEPT